MQRRIGPQEPMDLVRDGTTSEPLDERVEQQPVIARKLSNHEHEIFWKLKKEKTHSLHP